MSLTIDKDWKGAPSETAPYHVHFSISQATGDIMINVDAPFHDDPRPPHPPGKVSDLYNHEVVEIFVSGYPTIHHDECPYLEIEVGPHGHYFLGFFLDEGDFANVDTTIDFENRPRTKIDYEKKRWKCEIAVPSFLLPEPICGEDLSVSWRVNAYAIHGEGERRKYLAHSPVPGERPNFHQLNSFREIKLFETNDPRGAAQKGQNSAEEKTKSDSHKPSSQVNESNGSTVTETVFEATQQLKDIALEDNVDDEEGMTPLEQAARQIRDRLLKSEVPMHLLELEEKFQRQIQPDEFVVLHDTVWKRKALSFRRRKLILTSKPRLIYLDGNGEYRGQIPWSMTKRLTLQKMSEKRFHITVHDNTRTYNFSFSQIGSDLWIDTLNELMNVQKQYLRKSGVRDMP